MLLPLRPSLLWMPFVCVEVMGAGAGGEAAAAGCCTSCCANLCSPKLLDDLQQRLSFSWRAACAWRCCRGGVGAQVVGVSASDASAADILGSMTARQHSGNNSRLLQSWKSPKGLCQNRRVDVDRLRLIECLIMQREQVGLSRAPVCTAGMLACTAGRPVVSHCATVRSNTLTVRSKGPVASAVSAQGQQCPLPIRRAPPRPGSRRECEPAVSAAPIAT